MQDMSNFIFGFFSLFGPGDDYYTEPSGSRPGLAPGRGPTARMLLRALPADFAGAQASPLRHRC